jgi:hypothetical protein
MVLNARVPEGSVLDLLVNPKLARKEPWRILVAAFTFVTFGVLAHLWLPEVRGSVIIFAMVPAIPLFWALLVREETREERISLRPKMSFAYHRRLIEILAYLFVGATIAYAAWYALLPEGDAREVFGDQLREIRILRLSATGLVVPEPASSTARAFSPSLFEYLFAHNLNVLFILFALTLVYGMGALYVLFWNASIIGVYLGARLEEQGLLGLGSAALGLVPHGALEVGGYLLATLAGGVLSVAIMRGHFRRPEFRLIIQDVALLTLAAIVLLAAGAAVEASY